MEATKEKGYAGESKRSIGVSNKLPQRKALLPLVSCSASLTYGGLPPPFPRDTRAELDGPSFSNSVFDLAEDGLFTNTRS